MIIIAGIIIISIVMLMQILVLWNMATAYKLRKNIGIEMQDISEILNAMNGETNINNEDKKSSQNKRRDDNIGYI